MTAFLKAFLCFLSISLFAVWSCQKIEVDTPDEPGTLEFRSQPDSSGYTSPAVPDRYMVIFNDDVHQPAEAARQVAAAHGIELRHTYAAALKGFSGVVPAGRLNGLRNDPRVARIEQVRMERLVNQDLPTGIDRIEADRNPAAAIDNTGNNVDLDVAIIDSGIDGGHPDLNVAGGVNFANGSPSNWGDGNGHGSHVAGTVGAIDNNIGVVGVAPGVRLYAVRVCGNSGFCFTDDIAAGIDWVKQRKQDANAGLSGGIDFAVANMSISTADDDQPCSNGSDAVHKAICSLVNEGVVFSLAAGNDNRLKRAYPEVLAVAAIADYDGIGGTRSTPTCRSDEDDTRANFSNYGASIDIAAPGVCIFSTWKDGGYNTISGTSMAAPHVAGAVALYLHANNRPPCKTAAEVDAVEDAILTAALAPVENIIVPFCSYRINEPTPKPAGVSLYVNGPAFGGDGSCDDGSAFFNNTKPTVTIDAPADGASFGSGESIIFSGTASDDEDGNLSANINWSSDLDGPLGTDASIATTLSDGVHTITAQVTDAGGASASDVISITVGTPNTPPTVTITSPANGTSFDAGTSISFAGSASDAEDGDLSSDISWTSSINGAIGTGSSFSTSTLSTGSHTITAEVADAGGATSSDAITLTVNAAGLNIDNVDPSVMGAPDTKAVTISGSGFQPGVSVSLEGGSGPAPQVTINSSSSNSISCTFTTSSSGPRKARAWKVRVTNPDGGTVLWGGDFIVDPSLP